MKRYLYAILAFCAFAVRLYRAHRAQVGCSPADPCECCASEGGWPLVPVTWCQLDRVSRVRP